MKMNEEYGDEATVSKKKKKKVKKKVVEDDDSNKVVSLVKKMESVEISKNKEEKVKSKNDDSEDKGSGNESARKGKGKSKVKPKMFSLLQVKDAESSNSNACTTERLDSPQDVFEKSKPAQDKGGKKSRNKATKEICKTLLVINVKLIDQDKFCHRHGVWDFTSKSTARDVVKAIEKAWRIDPLHQELYHKETRIIDLDYNLGQLNISNKDEIFVKHADLTNWLFYLNCWKNVKDTRMPKKDRTEFAHMGIAHSKMLESSGFIIAYNEFNEKWCVTIGELIRFVDTTQPILMQSATVFFSKMFPGCRISFKEKKGGSRTGIVVTVTLSGNETNYFMKTYHNAGSSSLQKTCKRHLPDLREMFAYRLLNLVGVGPMVCFPYYEGSTFIHFIATQEVSGFKEVDKVENRKIQEKIIVEAYLLSLILGIRDLNEGNVGVNEEEMLSIIDFYVPDACTFHRSDIVNVFKTKNYCGGLRLGDEILPGIKCEDRMEIGKQAVFRWKQIENIDSEIISAEKIELRKHGIVFCSATVDLDQYVSDIKLNYFKILSAFTESVADKSEIQLQKLQK